MKRINELHVLINESEEKTSALQALRKVKIDLLNVENEKFEIQMAKDLALPENYEVRFFNYSKWLVSFDVRKYYFVKDEKKTVFASGYDMRYDLDENKIGLNKGTSGIIYSNETDRIEDVDVFVEGLYKLDLIEFKIDEFLKSIEKLIDKIDSLNKEMVDNENSLFEYKQELNDLKLSNYLNENNNIIEFIRPTYVQFRNGSGLKATKLEVLKRLPKGDYRVQVSYENWLNSTVSTTKYITHNMLMKLFKDMIGENKL